MILIFEIKKILIFEEDGQNNAADLITLLFTVTLINIIDATEISLSPHRESPWHTYKSIS